MIERWFVYDIEEGLRIFLDEKAAHDEFLKLIEMYRNDAACDDEWDDDVEDVTWGKVYQTVELQEVEPTIDNDSITEILLDEDCEEEGWCADISVIEHRPEIKS